MAYTFFYVSVIVILLSLIVISAFIKKPSLPSILIGLVTVGYALITDTIIGDQLKLFHYITPQQSTLIMVLTAPLVYAPLNILYAMFLPRKPKSVLLYTLIWIIGMLAFEHVSVLAKCIVFTGWIMIPWSIVLYIVAYTWIYFLHRYLSKKMAKSAS